MKNPASKSCSTVRPSLVILAGAAFILVIASVWLALPHSSAVNPEAETNQEGPGAESSMVVAQRSRPPLPGARTKDLLHDSTTPTTEKVMDAVQASAVDRQQRAVDAANEARQVLTKPGAIDAADPTPSAGQELGSLATPTAASSTAVPEGVRGYRRESDRVRRAFVSDMRAVRQATILESMRGAETNQ